MQWYHLMSLTPLSEYIKPVFIFAEKSLLQQSIEVTETKMYLKACITPRALKK